MKSSRIKTVLSLAVVAMACFALTTSANAAVISTFDSNLEGWTVSGTDGESISQVGSGGNPGGYVNIGHVGASMQLDAPAAFLGDLSAYDGGTFSWDGKAFDEGTGGAPPASYAYGKVTLTGPAGSATHPGIPSASRPTVADGWTGFSLDFTATAFGKTQVEWDAILADVTSVTLGGNVWKGFETIGYDNIAIVPEPATMSLLAIGGLGALLKRRRRRA